MVAILYMEKKQKKRRIDVFSMQILCVSEQVFSSIFKRFKLKHIHMLACHIRFPFIVASNYTYFILIRELRFGNIHITYIRIRSWGWDKPTQWSAHQVMACLHELQDADGFLLMKELVNIYGTKNYVHWKTIQTGLEIFSMMSIHHDHDHDRELLLN